MKKQLISLCCFLAFVTVAQAQNSGQFGLRVGASLGHYSLNASGFSYGFADRLQGFGRLTYALPSSGRTGLQFETGVGKRSLSIWLPGEIGFPSAPRISLTKLDAALLVRHTVSLPGTTSIQLIGGPALAYTLAASSHRGDSRQQIDLPASGINRLDVGLEVGASISFGLHQQYGLELRYGRGFSSLLTQEDGAQLFHQQLSANLNYRF